MIRGITRVYRLLLAVYPRDFRARFGREAVVMFEDRVRGDAARYGTARALLLAARFMLSAAVDGIRSRREYGFAISRDLGIAARGLRRDPVATAVAVLVTAIACATSAAVLPLAEGLQQPVISGAGRIAVVSGVPTLGAVRRTGLFSQVEAVSSTRTSRMAQGTSHAVTVAWTTPGFWRMAGLDLDVHGPAPLAVGDHLRDSIPIGIAVEVNGTLMLPTARVPAEFRIDLAPIAAFPERIDLWSVFPDDVSERPAREHALIVLGRLRDHVRLSDVRAALTRLSAGADLRLALLSDLAGGYRRSRITAAISGAMIVNIGILAFLAMFSSLRTLRRRAQLELLARLGAPRPAVVRLLFCEALLVGLAGCLAGAILVPMVRAFSGQPDAAPDAMWALLLAGLAVLVCFAAAAATLWLARSVRVGVTLRGALLGGQLMAAVVFFTWCGTLIRSLNAVTGGSGDDAVAVDVALPYFAYADPAHSAQVLARIETGLRALDGVTSVTRAQMTVPAWESRLTLAPAMSVDGTAVAGVLRAIDPSIAIVELIPLAAEQDRRAAPLRTGVRLASWFSFVVVMLAVAGAGQLMAWMIHARQRSLAVRLAFGASRLSLVAGEVRRSALPIVAGALTGVLIASTRHARLNVDPAIGSGAGVPIVAGAVVTALVLGASWLAAWRGSGHCRADCLR